MLGEKKITIKMILINLKIKIQSDFPEDIEVLFTGSSSIRFLEFS